MKAFSDLEQSKVLSKILRLESADMCWQQIYDENHMMSDHRVELLPYRLYSGIAIPCWSLAALLEEIPSDIKTKDNCNYTLEIEKCDAEHLPCGLNYHDTWGRGEDIITHYYDNFVDACYEMIIKLHEQKIL